MRLYRRGAPQSVLRGERLDASVRDCAGGASRLRMFFGDGAVQSQRVGKHQPFFAPDAPAIENETARDRLAHPGASEDHGFGKDEPSVESQIDFDRAVHAGAVEKDRLLW